MAYRALVTASRDWDDPELMWFVLASVVGSHLPDVVIIHGNYGRGDMLADAWAVDLGLEPERHDPDWKKFGRVAGPKRNAEMVQAGADVCLAFIRNASRGATGCADLAEAAGIKTMRYRSGTPVPRVPPGPALGD